MPFLTYFLHPSPISSSFHSSVATINISHPNQLTPFSSWGIVPIVREAQNEPTLEFPKELDAPWKVLQKRFGITSPGGNLTSNVYANVDTTGTRRAVIGEVS